MSYFACQSAHPSVPPGVLRDNLERTAAQPTDMSVALGDGSHQLLQKGMAKDLVGTCTKASQQCSWGHVQHHIQDHVQTVASCQVLGDTNNFPGISTVASVWPGCTSTCHLGHCRGLWGQCSTECNRVMVFQYSEFCCILETFGSSIASHSKLPRLIYICDTSNIVRSLVCQLGGC